MIGYATAVRIKKDKSRPLGDIIDFGYLKVLIDSRKVGNYFETMAVKSSDREDEEWDWSSPIYEKYYYTKSEMMHGHYEAVRKIAEQYI